MTLDEARALGSSRYEGKPCSRGHGRTRMTANNTCVVCNNAAVLARNNARYSNDPRFVDDTKAREYNTRARKFGCEGTLTGADLRAVRTEQDGLCICGERGIAIFDHREALFKRGPNTRSNLRGLCEPCDAIKFSADRREWSVR